MRSEMVEYDVWGRWTNGLYYQGHVTGTSGGKINVTFNDGDKISHDQNDISAILRDVVPNPTHVPVGSRVIAGWKDRNRYYKGRVTKVNSSVYTPQYYIWYDDGDKGWQTFDKVRLLPMRVDEVGARVYGRWTNSLYYPGKVESLDSKIHIKFDDGDRIAHDLRDVKAVILDVSPHPSSVLEGSRVIAFWPNTTRFYPGYVESIDKWNTHQVRYFIHYDDGDKGWANLDQLRLIPPAPGPAQPAQFRVINLGGNVIALNSIAYPQYFLGIDNGRLTGKSFDNYCHFYIHETPDHYVSLESCMLPGQHVGVNRDRSMTLPEITQKTADQALFEVVLLFSPYAQNYKADHI